MTQTRIKSFWEALFNTGWGLTVTLFFAPLVYRMSGIHATFFQIGKACVMLTIVSVVRNYLVRRYFNKKQK